MCWWWWRWRLQVYFGTAVKNVSDLVSGHVEDTALSRFFFYGGLLLTFVVTGQSQSRRRRAPPRPASPQLFSTSLALSLSLTADCGLVGCACVLVCSDCDVVGEEEVG